MYKFKLMRYILKLLTLANTKAIRLGIIFLMLILYLNRIIKGSRSVIKFYRTSSTFTIICVPQLLKELFYCNSSNCFQLYFAYMAISKMVICPGLHFLYFGIVSTFKHSLSICTACQVINTILSE